MSFCTVLDSFNVATKVSVRTVCAGATFAQVSGINSSAIVICDDLHFRNICLNAKTSTFDFVNPFVHEFPTEVLKQVKNFYDGNDGKGKWTYTTWSNKLQTDC